MWDGLHMDKERKDWAPLVVDYGEYDPLKVGSIDGTDLRPHDRAITRAIQAKYRPNKQVKGDYERTLFVGRLSSDTREDTIIDHFSKYGKIKNCRLVRDIITGQSKRYAFVEFKHQSDMKRALEKAHHILIDDKKIIVEQELERFLPGWKPRRFGGGLGGQKESGQLRFGGQGRPFKRPIVLGNQAQKYNNERRREWERQRRSCDSHGPKN